MLPNFFALLLLCYCFIHIPSKCSHLIRINLIYQEFLPRGYRLPLLKPETEIHIDIHDHICLEIFNVNHLLLWRLFSIGCSISWRIDLPACKWAFNILRLQRYFLVHSWWASFFKKCMKRVLKALEKIEQDLFFSSSLHRLIKMIGRKYVLYTGKTSSSLRINYFTDNGYVSDPSTLGRTSYKNSI